MVQVYKISRGRQKEAMEVDTWEMLFEGIMQSGEKAEMARNSRWWLSTKLEMWLLRSRIKDQIHVAG